MLMGKVIKIAKGRTEKPPEKMRSGGADKDREVGRESRESQSPKGTHRDRNESDSIKGFSEGSRKRACGRPGQRRVRRAKPGSERSSFKDKTSLENLPRDEDLLGRLF